MYRTLLATTAALLTGCAASSSSAQCDGAGASLPCGRDLVEVAIVDRDTGERLTVYSHEGQRWVAGTPGHRYAISVRSKWSGRVLSVVSVDGVNVVSGETAAWGQGGYVLSPWASYDVLGWRKSQDRVAGFFFTDLGDSYAARTGRPEDVGVIGVAAFREALSTIPPAVSLSEARPSRWSAAPPPPAPSATEPPSSRREAPTAPLAASPGEAASGRANVAPASPKSDQILGTGHGDSETSIVANTHFDRAQERPDQVITIRYDRHERLVAMGVIPGSGGPRPFPQSASAGFVPDPPQRR